MLVLSLPVARTAQVNLRGLPALLRAELQWGLWAHTQKTHRQWELPWVQDLADQCRERGPGSLVELDPGDDAFRRAVGRGTPTVAAEILRGLGTLYATPEATREQGYILTGHFGRRLPGRPGRIDLTGTR